MRILELRCPLRPHVLHEIAIRHARHNPVGQFSRQTSETSRFFLNERS